MMKKNTMFMSVVILITGLISQVSLLIRSQKKLRVKDLHWQLSRVIIWIFLFQIKMINTNHAFLPVHLAHDVETCIDSCCDCRRSKSISKRNLERLLCEHKWWRLDYKHKLDDQRAWMSMVWCEMRQQCGSTIALT